MGPKGSLTSLNSQMWRYPKDRYSATEIQNLPFVLFVQTYSHLYFCCDLKGHFGISESAFMRLHLRSDRV